MENTFLLEYIEKDSVIHRLNGAAKLICFILWTVAIMLTYDTRLLAALTLLGFVLFKISKITSVLLSAFDDIIAPHIL